MKGIMFSKVHLNFLIPVLQIASVFYALYPVAVWAVEPITPIPLKARLDINKVSLGKQLFHDRRLSKDNSISCASCHPLNNAGMDGKVVSVGVNGRLGVINTPTVFNSSLNFVQFWDGRALTLEDQIDGPVHNPNEMATDWPSIIKKLSMDHKLSASFNEVYSNGISSQSIKDAIATFERSLNTPNSRFDRYLRGDTNAITRQELEGYKLFKAYGCTSCHQGVAVGGNMFEKMGVIHDYFAGRVNMREADNGRYNVTGIEEHRHEFKVPSLRNIMLTAPYFHDGSAPTLLVAIQIMSKYQLGRTVGDEDIYKIIKFLHTLTGEFGEYANE